MPDLKMQDKAIEDLNMTACILLIFGILAYAYVLIGSRATQSFISIAFIASHVLHMRNTIVF